MQRSSSGGTEDTTMVKEAVEYGTLTDQNGVECDTITTTTFQFRTAFIVMGVGERLGSLGPTLEFFARQDAVADGGGPGRDEQPTDKDWREVLKFDFYATAMAQW